MKAASLHPGLKAGTFAFGTLDVARYLQPLFLCDSAAAAAEPLCPSQLVP